jgi:RimJ/RimL family protein N-acetyltransferase
MAPEAQTAKLFTEHNVGSIRVLAKCGFVVVGEEQHPGDPIKEIVLRLDI